MRKIKAIELPLWLLVIGVIIFFVLVLIIFSPYWIPKLIYSVATGEKIITKTEYHQM